MKIGIIGAGAMGSLLGFYLCERAEVWLLDSWQAQVDAINHSGLRRELDGAEETRYPHARTSPAAIGPCDMVLVLVKAHQTAWAAEEARTLLKPEGKQGDKETKRQAEESAEQKEVDHLATPSPPHPVTLSRTLVVTLQNGVGNRELLAEALGSDRVGQGVTALGATLLGPGRVRHAGQGPTIFGATPDRSAMAALAELFRACGLPAGLTDDPSTGAGQSLEALVWSKLMVNAGINALTALLRVPNGALATRPEARALVERAVAEAVAVAVARGTPLTDPDPLAHVLAVAQATGANRSSMLQDVLRGSPTEIGTINGAVVREGRRLGIPTPTNELLTALVQALDATAELRVQQ